MLWLLSYRLFSQSKLNRTNTFHLDHWSFTNRNNRIAACLLLSSHGDLLRAFVLHSSPRYICWIEQPLPFTDDWLVKGCYLVLDKLMLDFHFFTAWNCKTVSQFWLGSLNRGRRAEVAAPFSRRSSGGRPAWEATCLLLTKKINYAALTCFNHLLGWLPLSFPSLVSVVPLPFSELFTCHARWVATHPSPA